MRRCVALVLTAAVEPGPPSSSGSIQWVASQQLPIARSSKCMSCPHHAL
jgi:hypothetical protein